MQSFQLHGFGGDGCGGVEDDALDVQILFIYGLEESEDLLIVDYISIQDLNIVRAVTYALFVRRGSLLPNLPLVFLPLQAELRSW